MIVWKWVKSRVYKNRYWRPSTRAAGKISWNLRTSALFSLWRRPRSAPSFFRYPHPYFSIFSLWIASPVSQPFLGWLTLHLIIQLMLVCAALRPTACKVCTALLRKWGTFFLKKKSLCGCRASKETKLTLFSQRYEHRREASFLDLLVYAALQSHCWQGLHRFAKEIAFFYWAACNQCMKA